MRNALLLFWDSLNDLTSSLGWARHPLRFLVWVLVALPAALFTYRLQRFNRLIRLYGTQFAAKRLLSVFYGGLRLVNPLPSFDKGGLIVSNHPGLGDSLALMAVLPPNRFLLVANERLFFQSMPEVQRRLIIVPNNPAHRHRVVGQILEAIAQGNLVVLYPAGSIEPDPAFRHWGWLPPSSPLLGEWSAVIHLIVQRLERFNGAVYPVMVGGVFARRALFSWWASLGKTREEKEKRAVGYQLLRQLGKQATIQLAFGQVLTATEFAQTPNLAKPTEKIKAICTQLVEKFTL